MLNVQTEGSEKPPGFATQLGRGLDIGTLSPSSQIKSSNEVIRCPPVLELRQLLQYQPISHETRAKLVTVLISHQFASTQPGCTNEAVGSEPRLRPQV